MIDGSSLPIILTLCSFLFVLSAVIFEWMDRAVAVVVATVFLLLIGALETSELIQFMDFNTLFLLLGMMLLVEVARESKLLSWMSIGIIQNTRGNPLFLFLLLIATTFFLSTFLANATTMMVLVPITIAITRGMGLDPKPYLFAEILFCNAGGTLTLIGDPANVIIGSAVGLSFTDFLKYNSLPIFLVSAVSLSILLIKYWRFVGPIQRNVPKMFLTYLLMEKIARQFSVESFRRSFALTIAGLLGITVFFFVSDILHLPIALLALCAGLLALLLSHRFVETHQILARVDWHLLIFFAGLFLQIGALEKMGVLEPISHFISTHADSMLMLALLVLWGIGLTSAFIENIPLVAMMIPVLTPILADGHLLGDPNLVWFALSLGACLGGNGSIIGSSASMVVALVSEKSGVKITFWEYFKVGYPITLVSLAISSIFLLFASQ